MGTVEPGLAPASVVAVHAVVALGMLVVLPLGLRLVGDARLTALARWWPLAALPGAVCLWLPRGVAATALAACYTLATFALAAAALAMALSATRRTARDLAVLTALGWPSVAGLALVAERAGYPLFGFELDVLTLTVAHFHYAGFAAALVAGLVCRATGDRPLARAAALTVPAGTALVLAGFFVSDGVELAGAAVLTAGMWTVGLLTWRDVRPATADRPARAALAISATVLAGTMLLALSWAAGQAFGWSHPSLNWMVALHGVVNAVGFGLCSVLAWRRREAGTGVWTS